MVALAPRNDARAKRRWWGVYLTVAPFLTSAPICSSAIGSSPAWTVRDSVEYTRYFGDQFEPWAAITKGPYVHASPDREHFFVVTWRGEIACDCNVFKILVFTSRDFRTTVAPKHASPMRELEMRSLSNAPAISQARWVDNGRSIAFLGASGSATPQVYLYEVAEDRLTRHTDLPLGVENFAYSANSIVYVGLTAKTPRRQYIQYPATPVGPEVMQVSFGLEYEYEWGVFRSFGTSPPQIIGRASTTPPVSLQRFWISPNGEFAIGLMEVDAGNVPPAWQGYVSRYAGSDARYGRRFSQFVLLNLRTGTMRPLLDAPSGFAVDSYRLSPDALWYPSSRRVIVTNTTLPLESGPSDRATSAYVVDIDLGSSTPTIISAVNSAATTSRKRAQLASVDWDDPGHALLLRFETGTGSPAGSRSQCLIAKDAHRRWILADKACPRADAESLAHDVKVSVEQDMNRPPRLVAEREGRVLELLPSDVDTSKIVPMAEVTWKDKQAREWRAGLLLPRHSDDTNGFPLVIQAGHFAPRLFLPDGSGLTAFAAQALVARGFAVLLLDRDDVAGVLTPTEGSSFVDGVDSAIDKLRASAPIDTTRIGLIGFSRTGFLANYLLTHPGRHAMSAAVVADWGDPSYVLYTSWSQLPSARSILPQIESLYGGKPFWANKAAWLAGAPGFNVEANHAPTLLMLNGRQNAATAYEFYAGMRILEQPAEMVLFPDGEHQLKRPKERLGSLQYTVDWLSFWLQNHEDQNDDKREQYVRWRALRSVANVTTTGEHEGNR